MAHEVIFFAKYLATSHLLLLFADVKDVHADHAASHLGKAIGLTTLVRSIPYHLRRRQTFIPVDLLVKVR